MISKLRHVILISYFPPRWNVGGAEITALNLSKYLSKRGSDVHVITRSDIVVPYREMIEGVSVHRTLYPQHSTRLMRGSFSFHDLVNYVSSFFEMLRLKPQLIHGIGMFPPGLIACVSSRVLRKPLIMMCTDSDVRLANPLVIKLFWKAILRTTRIMIVKETESANRLARYVVDKRKIIVLANGVDTSRFQLNRRECRELIGIKGNELAILYVGRLEPVKNVETLLLAFARIKADFHNVRLFIVGGGTEMRRLMRIAEQAGIDRSTKFVGEVSPRDVPPYTVAANIFVLPSISEGSPNALLEALAAGVPILASKVGGIPDLVTDGREGFLFEAGDVAQMVDLLALMLRDGELRQRMSKAGRKRANKFTLDRANDKIFRISMNAMGDSSTCNSEIKSIRV
ncbi:MAG TPA: glycosyltransferase family 4 protein [Candidatus Bathyarchaeia archaeon]|nr:glycosyltransferase family 4 protein [Candidatus Bathyarchaeia archaeon]